MNYNKDIYAALHRYIDEYKWGWRVARRQLRMRFGVDMAITRLQLIYKYSKEANRQR